jgi:hypothetical protein
MPRLILILLICCLSNVDADAGAVLTKAKKVQLGEVSVIGSKLQVKMKLGGLKLRKSDVVWYSEDARIKTVFHAAKVAEKEGNQRIAMLLYSISARDESETRSQARAIIKTMAGGGTLRVQKASPTTATGGTTASRTTTRSTGSSAKYHPRSKAEIEERLRALMAVKPAAGGALANADNIYAVNRLNTYRYLCGIDADVKLDAGLCETAEAGAALCQKIGRLDHTPANPGMPEAQFKKGYEGTSKSNLAMGGGTSRSVDMYMNDSDPSNIERVGHRRWCLSPVMGKVGFGQADRYSAMYVFDRSRKADDDFEYSLFPAAGYMPTSHFRSGYAWSANLSSGAFGTLEQGKVKVKVFPVTGKTGNPKDNLGAPLELNFFTVSSSGRGSTKAVIFRPTGVDVSDGSRYWVEITGLESREGRRADIEYLVEFFDARD